MFHNPNQHIPIYKHRQDQPNKVLEYQKDRHATADKTLLCMLVSTLLIITRQPFSPSDDNGRAVKGSYLIITELFDIGRN